MRLALVLSLALAACADAPPADVTAPPGDAPGLTLSAEGLAGLGPETPFTPEAVAAAVGEDVTVEPGPDASPGGPAAETLWVLRDGLLLAEVLREVRMADAGRLTRVDVVGEGIAGPGGAEVGQAFAETALARNDCEVGTDEHAGAAVCRTGGVSLIFAHSGDPAALPPAEALAEAVLTRMVWRAR